MKWKTKARLSAAAYLLLASIAANVSPGIASGNSAPTVSFAESQPAVEAAQATARMHLDRFLDHVLQEQGTARADASIKIALKIDEANVEMIWVTPFASLGGDQFVGRLANAPRSTSQWQDGDAIHFSRADVRDWSFSGPDGRLFGSYTTRALLPHLTSEQAAQISSLLSDSPEPAWW